MSDHPRATLCTIADWRRAYRDQGARPEALLQGLVQALATDDPAWIWRADAAWLKSELARIGQLDAATAPLWGVPFAVKDNIDVAGLPTTAACPAFAYTAGAHATAVQRLMAAGAVLVGKTNLDQFATGLVGTRSPYGEVPNSFDAAYVSGGSSAGSASVVARGLVPFALGTDTAGSGRVPAGFNNLVGLKPTPGRAGMAGVLPACKSLDVVSVFALTVADAAEVAACIDGPDAQSAPQSPPLRPAWLPERLRVGVPASPRLDHALAYPAAWAAAVAQAKALGAELVPVDMGAFHEVAALLYDGPWVAERYAVVRELISARPDTLDATVRRVIEKATRFSAMDAYKARYELEDLARRIAPLWQAMDVLMVPTSPSHPTRAQVAAEPVARNSELGTYTNFVNLLGLAALAVPAGFTSKAMPFGVTFIGPGGSDTALAGLGQRWQQAQCAAGPLMLGAHLRPAQADDLPLGPVPAAAPTLALAVVGAHLQGLPLHSQLQVRGCRLLQRTRSAPHYRLFALPGTVPPKPGLSRVLPGQGGTAIELEVYEMPLDLVGSFLALIPPPLGLGSVELADGQWVKGFICEGAALQNATDISHFGGWRAYLADAKARAAT